MPDWSKVGAQHDSVSSDPRRLALGPSGLPYRDAHPSRGGHVALCSGPRCSCTRGAPQHDSVYRPPRLALGSGGLPMVRRASLPRETRCSPADHAAPAHAVRLNMTPCICRRVWRSGLEVSQMQRRAAFRQGSTLPRGELRPTGPRRCMGQTPPLARNGSPPEMSLNWRWVSP